MLYFITTTSIRLPSNDTISLYHPHNCSDLNTITSQSTTTIVLFRNRLLVCGQAASHCVDCTIKDLAIHFQDKSQLYLLENGNPSSLNYQQRKVGPKLRRDLKDLGVNISNTEDVFELLRYGTVEGEGGEGREYRDMEGLGFGLSSTYSETESISSRTPPGSARINDSFHNRRRSFRNLHLPLGSKESMRMVLKPTKFTPHTKLQSAAKRFLSVNRVLNASSTHEDRVAHKLSREGREEEEGVEGEEENELYGS